MNLINNENAKSIEEREEAILQMEMGLWKLYDEQERADKANGSAKYNHEVRVDINALRKDGRSEKEGPSGSSPLLQHESTRLKDDERMKREEREKAKDRSLRAMISSTLLMYIYALIVAFVCDKPPMEAFFPVFIPGVVAIFAMWQWARVESPEIPLVVTLIFFPLTCMFMIPRIVMAWLSLFTKEGRDWLFHGKPVKGGIN